LDRWDGIASAGADEGLLEAGMGDRFMGAHEARPELSAGSSHLEIGEHRLTAGDTAGDEDRHVAHMRQNLLGDHAGRDRADMAAGFHGFDDDRIGAHANQLPRNDERRRKAKELDTRRLDPRYGGGARQRPGEDDMADLAGGADIDEIEQPRVEGD